MNARPSTDPPIYRMGNKTIKGPFFCKNCGKEFRPPAPYAPLYDCFSFCSPACSNAFGRPIETTGDVPVRAKIVRLPTGLICEIEVEAKDMDKECDRLARRAELLDLAGRTMQTLLASGIAHVNDTPGIAVDLAAALLDRIEETVR